MVFAVIFIPSPLFDLYSVYSARQVKRLDGEEESGISKLKAVQKGAICLTVKFTLVIFNFRF